GATRARAPAPARRTRTSASGHEPPGPPYPAAGFSVRIEARQPHDGAGDEMKIAVAGGTGTAGQYVVTAARDVGDEVTVLSRRTGVDVASGKSLARAIEQVDAIIDVKINGSLAARVASRFHSRTLDMF